MKAFILAVISARPQLSLRTSEAEKLSLKTGLFGGPGELLWQPRLLGKQSLGMQNHEEKRIFTLTSGYLLILYIGQKTKDLKPWADGLY